MPSVTDNAKGKAEKKLPVQKNQRVATMEDPAVAAAAETRFRFATEEQAKDALDKLCRRFTLAKDSPEPDVSGRHTEAKLWIRGFDITEEEKAKGARGNYAHIKVKRISGRYTLATTKLAIDVSHHPEKERPKTRHPNWGHPVLRAALAEKGYPTLEKAYKQLMDLHYEYPEATIPGADTMHVMVYSHHADHSMPIDKIVLKIRVLAEGGVKLAIKGKVGNKQEKAPLKSAAQPKTNAIEAIAAQEHETEMAESSAMENAEKPSKKSVAAEPGATSPVEGKFTTMVIQRRRKRAAAPARKTRTKKEE